MKHTTPRRTFIKQTALASAAFPLLSLDFQQPEKNTDHMICVFSKHLQFLPDYSSMAEVAAEIGFDGIDLAVRPGGHVLPENVEKDLPNAVLAVEDVGLTVPMMTTGILSASEPLTKPILKTANNLGISYYRMGYYSYDMKEGVEASLENYKPEFKALALLNKQYQIHGAYQNHDGNRVGAAIWDVWELIKDLSPEFMGIQYDIRHAVVEGGKSWVLDLNLVKSHIRTLVIKDFKWEKNEKGQWVTQHVPLGEGMVDFDKFFSLLKEYDIKAPISMHFEYDWYKKEDPLDIKKAKTIEVMKKDLEALKKMI